MDTLPFEIFEKILLYLSFADIRQCELVCRTWNAIFKQSWTRATTLFAFNDKILLKTTSNRNVLKIKSKNYESALKWLANRCRDNLLNVELKFMTFNDCSTFYEMFSENTTLENLSLSCININDRNFANYSFALIFSSLNNLKSLSVIDCPLGGQQLLSQNLNLLELDFIPNNLVALTLEGLDLSFTFESFYVLCQRVGKTLEQLSLKDQGQSPIVHRNMFPGLQLLTNLKRLYLRIRLTNCILDRLSNCCPLLNEIRIAESDVSSDYVITFLNSKQKILEICDLPMCSNVNESILECLKHRSKEFTMLNVYVNGTSISIESVEAFFNEKVKIHFHTPICVCSCD